MSLFTTRVELHGAEGEDYEELHKEMEKEGFWRTIGIENKDVKYHLPTAEYNYGSRSSNSTTNTKEVLELAKKAANRTKLTFSVLVTKVANDRREWHNLDKVEKE